MDEQIRIKNELMEKLKTVSEDKDFLLAIVNYAKHIEDRKTIIHFIDTAEDATYENITLLALTLYDERKDKNC